MVSESENCITILGRQISGPPGIVDIFLKIGVVVYVYLVIVHFALFFCYKCLRMFSYVNRLTLFHLPHSHVIIENAVSPRRYDSFMNNKISKDCVHTEHLKHVMRKVNVTHSLCT